MNKTAIILILVLLSAPVSAAATIQYDDNTAYSVEYAENGDITLVQDWADSSNQRQVIEHNSRSNTVVVSAPARVVTGGGLLNIIGQSSTPLTDRVYVESVSPVRPVTIPDPVNLKTSEELTEQTHPVVWGDWPQSGVATADDVNKTSLQTTREHIGDTRVTPDGSGVRVAVIDDGVTTDNGTLYQHRIAAYNAVTEESGWSNVTSASGHGSWVASAIMADPNTSTTGEPGEGVAPEAGLLACKALSSDSGSSADVAECIRWADRHGADVIQMSLGAQGYTQDVADAIKEATGEGGNVSVVVISAGNNRQTTRYLKSPADTPDNDVLTVGATTDESPDNAQSAYFSAVGPDPGTLDSSWGETRGETVDIAAPGTAITAKIVTESGTIKTETLSGTSMAAPLVSGAAAVTLSSGVSGDDIPSRLTKTASPVQNAGVTEVGSGMVNVSNAVQNTQPNKSQSEVRTSAAEQRDQANRALSGWAHRFDVAGLGTRILNL